MSDSHSNTPGSKPGTSGEELHSALFALIPDGVIIIDPETALPVKFNPAAHQQLGYSAEEFASLRVPDYEAEETPEQIRAHIAKIFQYGQDNFETRHRRKDGTLIDVKVSVLLMDVGGKPYILGIYRDISAHKQAEQKLQRSEALMASIVDNIPVMVFLKQADSLRFEMLNRAGEALLGFSQQEIAGKNDYDFFPGEQADFFTTNDQSVLASHQLKDIPEESILTSSGETRILHTRKIGIYDPAGKPTHLLGVSIDITDHQKAEIALQREHDFAIGLVNTAPMVILLLDTQGMIQHVNPFFEQLSGYRLDEIQGKEWFTTFLPERDQERIRALFKTATHDVPTRGNINPIVTRSGDERDIEWNAQAMHDAQGNVTSVLAVGQDVTVRKAMEQVLRTSEERLNEAQRIAQVGSWELDLPSGKLFWTDEIFRLFEIDRNQFDATYEAFLNAIHPDDRNSVNLAYSHSLETRSPYEITHRLLMPDGRIKWVHERCNSYFDTDGTPLRSVGTVQDITKQWQAEENLRRSMEQYEELAERIPVGVYTFRIRTNGSMAFDYVSPRFCQLLDVFAEDVLADSAMAFARAHPDELDGLIRLIREVGRTLHPFLWEGRAVIHGEICWLRIESAPSLQENGDSLWNGVVSDISERKRAEIALNQLNEELEQRVAERTIELVRAKEEADRANSAKSEFLSRMSHELRTPMNAILGFGQLLETDTQHPLAADQQENIQEILRAGSHLLALINEVLDLSRVESGRLELVPEAVTIAPLVDECAALVQSLADQRNIRISTYTEGDYSVQADRLRLRQILLNLLSNAIKYNREGGTIRITCHPPAMGRVRIAVSDSGRGIPADAMARLFMPFERIVSTYDGIEGTGIGLAIAKKLTEAMSGTIGMESGTGEGCTFWVELPLAATETALPATASGKPESSVCTTAHTLLYIEDNPANLRLVQKIVAPRKGLALLDAHTAELGLEIARMHQPDLILLDINLPGMDGHEALLQLQNNPATCHIPVIAITANAMESDIRKGLDAGFVAYLTKPLQISGFLALLDELLEPDRSN